MPCGWHGQDTGSAPVPQAQEAGPVAGRLPTGRAAPQAGLGRQGRRPGCRMPAWWRGSARPPALPLCRRHRGPSPGGRPTARLGAAGASRWLARPLLYVAPARTAVAPLPGHVSPGGQPQASGLCGAACDGAPVARGGCVARPLATPVAATGRPPRPAVPQQSYQAADQLAGGGRPGQPQPAGSPPGYGCWGRQAEVSPVAVRVRH